MALGADPATWAPAPATAKVEELFGGGGRCDPPRCPKGWPCNSNACCPPSEPVLCPGNSCCQKGWVCLKNGSCCLPGSHMPACNPALAGAASFVAAEEPKA